MRLMSSHFPALGPSARLALCLLGLCTGLLGVTGARAERADRDQPLEIDAGQLRIDGKRKLKVLSGSVEIRRGSLLIRAEQIELQETPQGEIATAIGSDKAPATFRQKRDGSADEWIEGRAQRVVYDTGTETVRLQQNAMLQRLTGRSVTEELSGQNITYSHARETVEVQGTPQPGSGGRVRAIVAPRPAAQAASGATP